MTGGGSVVVGLMGRKGSGKDTAAEGLARLGFVRVAFADALRATLEDVNPFVDVSAGGPGAFSSRAVPLRTVVGELGWDRAKREIPDVRRLMQEHGVAVRRHVDPDVWVDTLARRVHHLVAMRMDVVVTDVRFPNEAEFIRRMDGALWRVHREGDLLAGAFLGSSADEHISEHAVDDVVPDVHLLNVSTAEELQRRAQELAWRLRESRN